MFWKLINSFGSEVNDLVDELDTSDKVKVFNEDLSFHLYELDTVDHAKSMGEYSYPDNFSEDLFLYARCAVVVKGKEVFEHVRDNPKEFPKDEFYEPLLLVPIKAARKHGFPFNFFSKYNKETGSNIEGWQKENMET
jgi:hypothetical protein